jgi:hypothetical protein
MNAPQSFPRTVSSEQVAGGVVVDASKVSPREFLDGLGLSSPEKRAADRAIMLADCTRAIERGDTHGWPPAMVEECLLAMRAEEDWDSFAPVERVSQTRIGK